MFPPPGGSDQEDTEKTKQSQAHYSQIDEGLEIVVMDLPVKSFDRTVHDHGCGGYGEVAEACSMNDRRNTQARHPEIESLLRIKDRRGYFSQVSFFPDQLICLIGRM